MTRSRRRISGAEKAAIVRRHLIDKVPVSDLCDELGLRPTQLYTWQKQLFENGEAAFDRPSRKTKQESAKDQKIAGLEAKLQKKNEVVAELLEEHGGDFRGHPKRTYGDINVPFTQPRSGSTAKPGVAQRTPGTRQNTPRNPNGVQLDRLKDDACDKSRMKIRGFLGP